VAGHVDDGEVRPVRQLERRVAEVDRDAAFPLLLDCLTLTDAEADEVAAAVNACR
jgi:hypothetical protein